MQFAVKSGLGSCCDTMLVAACKPSTPRSILRRNTAESSPPEEPGRKTVTFEEGSFAVDKVHSSAGGKVGKRSGLQAARASRRTGNQSVGLLRANLAHNTAISSGTSPPSSSAYRASFGVKTPGRAKRCGLSWAHVRSGAGVDFAAEEPGHASWQALPTRNNAGSGGRAVSSTSSSSSSRGHRMFQLQEAMNRAANNANAPPATAAPPSSVSKSGRVGSGLVSKPGTKCSSLSSCPPQELKKREGHQPRRSQLEQGLQERGRSPPTAVRLSSHAPETAVECLRSVNPSPQSEASTGEPSPYPAAFNADTVRPDALVETRSREGNEGPTPCAGTRPTDTTAEKTPLTRESQTRERSEDPRLRYEQGDAASPDSSESCRLEEENNSVGGGDGNVQTRVTSAANPSSAGTSSSLSVVLAGRLSPQHGAKQLRYREYAAGLSTTSSPKISGKGKDIPGRYLGEDTAASLSAARAIDHRIPKTDAASSHGDGRHGVSTGDDAAMKSGDNNTTVRKGVCVDGGDGKDCGPAPISGADVGKAQPSLVPLLAAPPMETRLQSGLMRRTRSSAVEEQSSEMDSARPAKLKETAPGSTPCRSKQTPPIVTPPSEDMPWRTSPTRDGESDGNVGANAKPGTGIDQSESTLRSDGDEEEKDGGHRSKTKRRGRSREASVAVSALAWDSPVLPSSPLAPSAMVVVDASPPAALEPATVTVEAVEAVPVKASPRVKHDRNSSELFRDMASLSSTQPLPISLAPVTPLEPPKDEEMKADGLGSPETAADPVAAVTGPDVSDSGGFRSDGGGREKDVVEGQTKGAKSAKRRRSVGDIVHTVSSEAPRSRAGIKEARQLRSSSRSSRRRRASKLPSQADSCAPVDSLAATESNVGTKAEDGFDGNVSGEGKSVKRVTAGTKRTRSNAVSDGPALELRAATRTASAAAAAAASAAAVAAEADKATVQAADLIDPTSVIGDTNSRLEHEKGAEQNMPFVENVETQDTHLRSTVEHSMEERRPKRRKRLSQRGLEAKAACKQSREATGSGADKGSSVIASGGGSDDRGGRDYSGDGDANAKVLTAANCAPDAAPAVLASVGSSTTVPGSKDAGQPITGRRTRGCRSRVSSAAKVVEGPRISHKRKRESQRTSDRARAVPTPGSAYDSSTPPSVGENRRTSRTVVVVSDASRDEKVTSSKRHKRTTGRPRKRVLSDDGVATFPPKSTCRRRKTSVSSGVSRDSALENNIATADRRESVLTATLDDVCGWMAPACPLKNRFKREAANIKDDEKAPVGAREKSASIVPESKHMSTPPPKRSTAAPSAGIRKDHSEERSSVAAFDARTKMVEMAGAVTGWMWPMFARATSWTKGEDPKRRGKKVLRA